QSDRAHHQRPGKSALPPKADIRRCKTDVRYGPKADSCGAAKKIAIGVLSALGQKQTFRTAIVMSALPPKADICSATAHVCYGPEADIKNRKTASRRSLRKLTSVLARSSLRGPRRQHCKCRGPRHQHCKYDRNENERRHISAFGGKADMPGR